jgi:hypothetical protein
MDEIGYGTIVSIGGRGHVSLLEPTKKPAGDQKGILPYHMIAALAKSGGILPIPSFDPDQIQPASLDLRLGEVAYRLRASFLPVPRTRVADEDTGRSR